MILPACNLVGHSFPHRMTVNLVEMCQLMVAFETHVVSALLHNHAGALHTASTAAQQHSSTAAAQHYTKAANE